MIRLPINTITKTWLYLKFTFFPVVFGMLVIAGCNPIQEGPVQTPLDMISGTQETGLIQEEIEETESLAAPSITVDIGSNQVTATSPLSQRINNQISGNIILWHPFQTGTPERQSLDSLVANANFMYPNLELETVQVPSSEIWRDYQIDVIAGGGPDLFIASNDVLLPSAQSGLIQNLDSFIEGKKDQFFPQAIDGLTYEGSLYGAPLSYQTVVVYFKKSNVPVPPQTNDNLLEMLKSGKQLVIIQSAYHLFGWSGAFGGILMDENGRCIADLTGWVGALNYLLELKNAGGLFENDYREAEEKFLSGDADMLLQGSWEVNRYATSLGENLGISIMPAGPSGPSSPLITVNGIYLNPNSTNKEAALEVVNFLTGQVAQQTFANYGHYLPARTDIQGGNELLEAVSGGIVSGVAVPQNEGFSNYWLPFEKMFAQVLNGEVSPQQGLGVACAEMNAYNNK